MGRDEVIEMPSELVVVVVAEALDGCVRDSADHAFDRAPDRFMKPKP